MFKNKDGVYEKWKVWNVNDSSMGNSAEFHAMYSKDQTEVVGFIVPRFTPPVVGMGDCERGWGVTKPIKYIHRTKFTGTKT